MVHMQLIITCDVGVSLHSKAHPLFMKYSKGTSTQCSAYIALSELVSCAFSTIPICPFFGIFHSLVANNGLQRSAVCSTNLLCCRMWRRNPAGVRRDDHL